MYKGLYHKWIQPFWIEKLLDNNATEIVEWNNWGDRIWGATLDGIRENKLGVLLMNMKEIFKQEITTKINVVRAATDFAENLLRSNTKIPSIYITKAKGSREYTTEAQKVFDEYYDEYYRIFSKLKI